MKKIFIMAAAMLIAVTAANAQGKGIKFENGSFKEILAKAKSEDKLVFVDVYATWCGPCKRMSADVFTREDVGEYFNSTFINAKFDAEKGEGINIAKRYGVRAYPTFLLLDGDGRQVGVMVGGSPGPLFIKKTKELVANAGK